MKKRGRFSTQKRKRTTKWTNMIVGLIFILLIGSVVWIGANGWNVERAVKSLQGNTEQPSEFEEIEPKLDNDATTESEIEKANELEETPLREVKEAPNAAEDPKEGESKVQSEQAQKKPSNPIGYIEGQELPAEPKYIKGVLIASKQYPLPKDFAPGESKEARAAFDEMAAAAATSGINLQAFSTYRSYDYQVTLYNRYVERDGREAADRYSARPGYSEHQTGLAFDIGEVNHEKHWASTSFGDTEAAKWLGANANQYGFILRYPEGKEEITGYMHESWHYRYVGKEKAEQIFKRNITLEEYLGVH
ncbi:MULTISPECIES: M15 family metallopeptidase [Sporosarcina]|uniref:D-alanyl-D-alanine carboxypeptidase n=1 Tax=Sporosarcina newyorkensis TaxID=759851 RepID=A0A1T4YN32_9BACL|nr:MULTISPECIES: M15 family metallopeptidase [Sporosarcina]MBY0222193.1 M15 family metallopeptidase [Sporosarcina aquimarina]SKB03244.1 D-alanyl-D-alanine carboxypeptidase [Sporosarcina newyorkensis]